MPELPLCQQCHRPILDGDAYVIPNKQAYLNEREMWEYCHVACYTPPA
jgi:hypothetical protein